MVDLGKPTMNARQQQALLALKLKHEEALDNGDTEGAAGIARQAQMFMSEPDRYMPPKSKMDVAEDVWRASGKGMKEYWQGVTSPIHGKPVEPMPPPPNVHPAASMGGEIFGSMVANPLTISKRAVPQIAQAAYEGYTAPASNIDERQGNALTSGLASVGLRGLGSLGNKIFDFNTDNPALPDALRYASKNKLDAPFIDEYSSNPWAEFMGWLVDEPMFAGRMIQNPKQRALAKHAEKKVGAMEEVKDLSESVIDRYSADYDMVESAYSDIWKKYPRVIDDEPMMLELDKIQEGMQEVIHLLPTKVKNKVTSLVETDSRSLEGWHEVRSLLREHSEQMKSKGTAGRRYLTKAVESLDDLMYGSLDEAGKKALREADTLYAQTIPKYTSMKALRSAIQEGNSEDIMRVLTDTKSPISAQKVWNSLDDDGRSTAMTHLHRRAIDEATGADGMFSPTRYGKFWNDFTDTAELILPKKQADEIKGMGALYSMAKKAEAGGSEWQHSRAISNAMTAAGITGIAAVASTGIAAPVVATIGSGAALLLLMRSRAGNKFLRSMGRAQNAAERAKAMYQLSKVVSRNPDIAAAAGVNTEELGAHIKIMDDNPDMWKDFVKGVKGLTE